MKGEKLSSSQMIHFDTDEMQKLKFPVIKLVSTRKSSTTTNFFGIALPNAP